MSIWQNTNSTRLCGFSIVELLAAVAIVGVIATLALPRYRAQVARARQAEATTSLSTIRDLQKIYYYEGDRGHYHSGLHYGIDKCGNSAAEGRNELGFKLPDCSKSRYRYITNAGNDCAKSDGSLDQGKVYPGCTANDIWHMSDIGKLTHTHDVIKSCPGGSSPSSCSPVSLPGVPVTPPPPMTPTPMTPPPPCTTSYTPWGTCVPDSSLLATTCTTDMVPDKQERTKKVTCPTIPPTITNTTETQQCVSSTPGTKICSPTCPSSCTSWADVTPIPPWSTTCNDLGKQTRTVQQRCNNPPGLNCTRNRPEEYQTPTCTAKDPVTSWAADDPTRTQANTCYGHSIPGEETKTETYTCDPTCQPSTTTKTSSPRDGLMKTSCADCTKSTTPTTTTWELNDGEPEGDPDNADYVKTLCKIRGKIKDETIALNGKEVFDYTNCNNNCVDPAKAKTMVSTIEGTDDFNKPCISHEQSTTKTITCPCNPDLECCYGNNVRTSCPIGQTLQAFPNCCTVDPPPPEEPEEPEPEPPVVTPTLCKCQKNDPPMPNPEKDWKYKDIKDNTQSLAAYKTQEAAKVCKDENNELGNIEVINATTTTYTKKTDANCPAGDQTCVPCESEDPTDLNKDRCPAKDNAETKSVSVTGTKPLTKCDAGCGEWGVGAGNTGSDYRSMSWWERVWTAVTDIGETDTHWTVNWDDGKDPSVANVNTKCADPSNPTSVTFEGDATRTRECTEPVAPNCPLEKSLDECSNDMEGVSVEMDCECCSVSGALISRGGRTACGTTHDLKYDSTAEGNYCEPKDNTPDEEPVVEDPVVEEPEDPPCNATCENGCEDWSSTNGWSGWNPTQPAISISPPILCLNAFRFKQTRNKVSRRTCNNICSGVTCANTEIETQNRYWDGITYCSREASYSLWRMIDSHHLNNPYTCYRQHVKHNSMGHIVTDTSKGTTTTVNTLEDLKTATFTKDYTLDECGQAEIDIPVNKCYCRSTRYTSGGGVIRGWRSVSHHQWFPGLEYSRYDPYQSKYWKREARSGCRIHQWADGSQCTTQIVEYRSVDGSINSPGTQAVRNKRKTDCLAKADGADHTWSWSDEYGGACIQTFAPN